MGYGAATGRRMGYCSGYAMPGYANAAGYGPGRGRGGEGRGLARRRGCGAGGYPGAPDVAVPVAPASESTLLKSRIDALEGSLAQLKQQLEAVEKATDE